MEDQVHEKEDKKLNKLEQVREENENLEHSIRRNEEEARRYQMMVLLMLKQEEEDDQENN